MIAYHLNFQFEIFLIQQHNTHFLMVIFVHYKFYKFHNQLNHFQTTIRFDKSHPLYPYLTQLFYKIPCYHFYELQSLLLFHHLTLLHSLRSILLYLFSTPYLHLSYISQQVTHYSIYQHLSQQNVFHQIQQIHHQKFSLYLIYNLFHYHL